MNLRDLKASLGLHLKRHKNRLADEKKARAAAKKAHAGHKREWGIVLRRRKQIAAAVKAQAAATHVSDQGVALIAEFEGFRSNPYRDAVGVWTIGYGHTAGVGPNTPPLSEPAARALLKQEVDAKYAPAVRALGLPLTQPMFDALTSFVYNLGPGIIGSGHTIGDALRRRDWRAAADAFLLYDKAGGRTLPGLTRRRQAERALFLRGL